MPTTDDTMPRHSIRARYWCRRLALWFGLVLVVMGAAACSTDRVDPADNQAGVVGRRVWVVVTEDGGRRLVIRRSVPLERGDTAISVLEEVADVRRDPDGVVAQVNGSGGGGLGPFGPDPSAWFYRVDGIESNIEPDKFQVRPGMSIWWDLRRFDIYERLPVAIGVFPEPLFSGWRQASMPLRIAYGDEFEEDADYFYESMFEAIDPDVVSITGQDGIGGVGSEDAAGDDPKTTVAVRPDRANFVIGRWEELLVDPYITDINTEQRMFGVSIWIEGTNIMRQDPDREASEELREAEGIVWASTVDGLPDSAPVIVVTGVTDKGVRAAARALRSGACQFHLACAVDRDGNVIR